MLAWVGIGEGDFPAFKVDHPSSKYLGLRMVHVLIIFVWENLVVVHEGGLRWWTDAHPRGQFRGALCSFLGGHGSVWV